ncbi:hypothetical protein ABT298_23685 [Streptomyces sp. NPDC001034]|uniref:hypothetical protein n=1 Tax=Streptomyces sp. NPDC001034 TaxID=3154375 RepID=UPI0033213537
MHSPENIIGELDRLHDEYRVTAFRLVDDLFLGAGRVVDPRGGADESVRRRDEFDISAGIQFGDVPLPEARSTRPTPRLRPRPA